VFRRRIVPALCTKYSMVLICCSMEKRGHNWMWVEPGGSAVQGVLRRWDGGFEAASEPRQRDSGGVSC
jgi:hypothetical protein